jgi:hypothetical protein
LYGVCGLSSASLLLLGGTLFRPLCCFKEEEEKDEEGQLQIFSVSVVSVKTPFSEPSSLMMCWSIFLSSSMSLINYQQTNEFSQGQIALIGKIPEREVVLKWLNCDCERGHHRDFLIAIMSEGTDKPPSQLIFVEVKTSVGNYDFALSALNRVGTE